MRLPDKTWAARWLFCFLICLAFCSPWRSIAQNTSAPTPEVQTQLDRAKMYEQQGKTDEALGQYEQAIQTARERKDREGEAAALAALIKLASPTLLAASAKTQPQQAILPVQTLLNEGHTKQKEARLSEAARLYEQALQTAREHKDRVGEALALTFQARLSLFEASLPRPQDYYLCAMPLYREFGDSASQANYLTFLGIGAVSIARKEEGIALFLAALQRFQASGDREGEALSFDFMGLLHSDAGQESKTLPYFQKALTLHKERGDRYRQTQTLLSLSKAAMEMRETEQAQTYLQEGLQITRDTGDKKSEGKFLLNLAGTKMFRGETRAALEDFTQCLPLLEATGDTKSVAYCLHNMQILYYQNGSYLKALEMQERSLALFRKLEDLQGIVRTLNDLGIFYLQTNQAEKALQYFQEALKANVRNRNVTDHALTLSNLGEVYGQLNQPQQARLSLEQALKLYREAEDSYGEASALRALSVHCLSIGNRQQALAYVTQAQEIFHKIGDKSGEAVALSQKGDCLVEEKQFAAASQCYLQALPLFQETEHVIGEASVLSRIATLKEKTGTVAEAAPFYAQSLALYERLRANLGGLTQAKVGYTENYLQSYQRYIDILLRTRQEEQAFQWTQRAKARVLVDLMEAGKVETRPILTAEEKQQEVALKRRDRELTRQWLKTLGDQDTLKRQGQADKTRQEQVEKQSRAVRQQQRQLERDWDAFSQAIYLRKPQEVQMRAAHTVTLKETAALLTEEDALLEYGVVRRIEGDREREQLVLFVVTREKGKPRLTVHRLPSDVPRLAKLASAFRLACAGRPGTASERPYKDLARQIYRLLLAPAEATLKYKRHLIFGPDGPLWEIPFQAALVSQPQASGMAKPNRPQFLWERYAISYAYSATGLKAALDVRQRPNRSRANQSLLVMANPDFGQRSASASATPRTASSVKNASRASETGGSVFLRGGPLSPLPHTLTEATAIQTYFPQAMVKSGKEAQEELLKRTGGNYRYLHLATHSLLNDSAPMLSGVALAQPPPNSQEDGILTARECFDLSLNAEMVVLSACETARGARHAGEGIIGLTWALFVAGVPTQVVSQWAVDDAATARLMGGLYRSLKQGKTKEQSLREAGLALLRNGKYQHPFYWAPFVILGDWR